MQMSLFDNNVEKLNLYKAVDNIKNQFGSQLIGKAASTGHSDSSSRNTTRHDKKKSPD
jgi:DNA polymerase IV